MATRNAASSDTRDLTARNDFRPTVKHTRLVYGCQHAGARGRHRGYGRGVAAVGGSRENAKKREAAFHSAERGFSATAGHFGGTSGIGLRGGGCGPGATGTSGTGIVVGTSGVTGA